MGILVFTTDLCENVILLGVVAILGAALHVEDALEHRLDKGSRARGHGAGWATDRAVIEC